MIDRRVAEAVFARAVQACAPERRVAEALAAAFDAELPDGRARIGVAAGKAAIAMARGARVDRGLAVAPDGAGDPASLPAGWRALAAGHPDPDERSEAAGRAVRELVAGAGPDDVVIALISGGASALIEVPRIPLGELRALAGALMAAGAPIRELNTVRGALSELKAGGLALATAAPVLTLVASDVVGDPLDAIGSGPTIVLPPRPGSSAPIVLPPRPGSSAPIGPWLAAPGVPVDAGAAAEARRVAALAILARRGLPAPPVLATPIGPRLVTRRDRAVLVAPLAAFADAALAALAGAGIAARRLDPPLEGDVEDAARRLAAAPGPFVAWGEPTVRVPADHGDGGRAQQLALALARLVRGTRRALLVAGSDGIDGPPPRDGRPPGRRVRRRRHVGRDRRGRHRPRPRARPLRCRHRARRRRRAGRHRPDRHQPRRRRDRRVAREAPSPEPAIRGRGDWTTLAVLDWTTQRFTDAGIASARLEAQLLLAHVLSCSRVQLYTGFDKPLAEASSPAIAS